MVRFGRKKVEKAVRPANASTAEVPPPQGVSMPPGGYGPPTASLSAWDATKFKIQLKMAKNRVEIQRGKKENEIESSRRLIAQHLSANKVPLARIQAERVLRELSQIRAFDVVETMVELLANSNNALGTHHSFDTLPGDIKEAMASVIYASKILNVPELVTVVGLLRDKFGPAVVDPIMNLQGPYVTHVNGILATSLDCGAPDGYLVMEELTRIAVENGINWVPPAEPESLDSHYAAYQQSPYGGPPSNMPPPPGPYGGGHNYGGGGFHSMQASAPPVYFAPTTNIPGAPGPTNMPWMNNVSNIPGAPGPTNMPWMNNMSNMPSAPPAPSAPPFDPSSQVTGSLYPAPGAYTGTRNNDFNPHPSAPPADGLAPSAPPFPDSAPDLPGAEFLTDDALEAKYRNIRDNYKQQ